MDFKRLCSVREPFFAEAFALYEYSFPTHERRHLNEQTALMSNPLYHFDIITESGTLTGILLYWQCSGYAYVEHFAIQPSMRNKSVGTAVSKMFFEKHPVVILEIDPVVDEVSARRERFYQRLGFKANGYEHKHPAYQRQFPPHELIVMSYPEQLTEKEYLLFQRELKSVVMKDVSAEQ